MTGAAHQLISIPDIDMASCHHVSDLEGSSLLSCLDRAVLSLLPPLSPPPASHRVTLPHFGSHSSTLVTLQHRHGAAWSCRLPECFAPKMGLIESLPPKKAKSLWENIVLVMRRYYRMIHARGLAKRKKQRSQERQMVHYHKVTLQRSRIVSRVHLVSCPD